MYMMSAFSQEVDVLEPRKSCRKIFDEILVLADDLLKDECPISQVEEWLQIDDTLLQLKLWGETVGVEQGVLEDIVLDKDLSLVIGEVLCSIILPLHKIEVWCEDPEAVELPQIKSRYVFEKRGAWKPLPDALSFHLLLITDFRISAAIDEFQVSTNSLTGTVELFRSYKAKSNNESFLQNFKPVSS